MKKGKLLPEGWDVSERKPTLQSDTLDDARATVGTSRGSLGPVLLCPSSRGREPKPDRKGEAAPGRKPSAQEFLPSRLRLAAQSAEEFL